MNKIKYILLSLCLLLTGCQNTEEKLELNFENIQTIAVCEIEDKIISPSEEEKYVNTVIEELQSHTFTKTDKVNTEPLYAIAWYPSSLQFDTSYNLKFRYNTNFYESAYDELFNNSSIDSITIIDNHTIICNNEYYKSKKEINLEVFKEIIKLSQNYTMKIYVPNENFDTLQETQIQTTEINEQSVLQELVNVGVIPDFIKVNHVSIDETTVYIDFNQDFVGFLNTMGSAGESIIIKAITNSYIKTYDMEKVTITCNSNIIETGHNIYDQPLTYMP